MIQVHTYIAHIKKILKKYFTKIGLNIIESVFAICDQNFSEQGLTLAEIQDNHCVDFLANTFGILHTNIEKDFAAFDKNGDGVVSMEEGLNAYKTFGLDLDRTPEMQKKLGAQWVLAVHGSLKLVNSNGYKEYEKNIILTVATALRIEHIKSQTYTLAFANGFSRIKYFVNDLQSTLYDLGYSSMNCYAIEKDSECNSYLKFYYKYSFRLEDKTLKLDCWSQ